MYSFWAFLGSIIILGVIGDGIVKIIKASKSGGSKQSSGRMDDFERDLGELERELEDARERIIVLEKIVTDDRYQLNKDLNDLAGG